VSATTLGLTNGRPGRMADWVLASDRLRPPAWWRGPQAASKAAEHLDWLQQGIRRAAVIVADNVAEYYYAVSDQEVWHIQDDFPCLAPPYPVFWVEHGRPSRINSCEYGVQSAAHAPDFAGVLFSVDDVEEAALAGDLLDDSPEHVDRLGKQIALDWPRLGPGLERKLGRCGLTPADVAGMSPEAFRARLGLDEGEMVLLGLAIQYTVLTQKTAAQREAWRQKFRDLYRAGGHPVPRWMVRALGYWYFRRHGGPHGGLVGPLAGWAIPVCKDGSVMPGFGPGFSLPVCDYTEGIDDRTAEVFADLGPLIHPALMALTFLNCKNVASCERDPDAGESEAHRRKHGRPLVKFKTLHIDPMTRLIREASRQPGGGGGSPLHICRGHFKDYRERGLFGRHKGIYWWDHYVRGSIERGVVFKDYDVN
jgi:hypothetical protein